MILSAEDLPRKSRLAALLDHFSDVEDPRDVRRILHPLPEVLFLVVCGSIADCDDYEDIAGWGAAHLDFLRRHLPYANGVPGERWLTILMNRIDPSLFSAAFAAWVRESWPEKAALVAIDGKTSRRSHDRAAGAAPLHLVSAFATTARLVLAQEAVPDKASELAAIPPLLERLGADGGLEGALVSIDAVATNPGIAADIAAQGADWLLAVKANQPTLRAEVEASPDGTRPTSMQSSPHGPPDLDSEPCRRSAHATGAEGRAGRAACDARSRAPAQGHPHGPAGSRRDRRYRAPAKTSDAPPLDAFLEGLKLAWCSTDEVRPTARPKPSKPRYRTVPDPLEAVTDTLKAWFDADPGVTGRQLLDRLQVAHPGGYPDSLARTVQRRLRVWGRERAKALVLGPSSAATASPGFSGDPLRDAGAPRVAARLSTPAADVAGA